jgi:hypothetical protein
LFFSGKLVLQLTAEMGHSPQRYCHGEDLAGIEVQTKSAVCFRGLIVEIYLNLGFLHQKHYSIIIIFGKNWMKKSLFSDEIIESCDARHIRS